MYNKHMTTKQNYKTACDLILAHDPRAASITQLDNENFMVTVGRTQAYYVIIDNKIVGDIWYD